MRSVSEATVAIYINTSYYIISINTVITSSIAMIVVSSDNHLNP